MELARRKTVETRASFLRPHLQKLVPWSVPIALLVVWQVLAQAGVISTRLLPAPTQVIEAAIRLASTGELSYHIGISSKRAILGFVVGGGIGFVLGLLNGVSSVAERLLDTSIQMIRNIPHLALIPLVILWFGIGEEARLFLVALGVSFPIYINTFYGIRNIDHGLIEMGKVYGLTTRELF